MKIKNKKKITSTLKELYFMTCIKAQSMITPFVNNKLNMKELEEFLDHIGSCPNCREELEFYYALLTAMKQLDEDKDLSNDFGLELSQKIARAQEKIIHVKYTYYRKIAVFILVVISLAFYLSIRYANKSEDNESNVTESNFRLRTSFLEERNAYIEWQLQEYLKEQGLEQIQDSADEEEISNE
jgi:hypothetical protein